MSGRNEGLDQETLRSLYKFHKGTTYSIGAKNNGAYREGSMTKDSFISPEKTTKDSELPGRRN